QNEERKCADPHPSERIALRLNATLFFVVFQSIHRSQGLRSKVLRSSVDDRLLRSFESELRRNSNAPAENCPDQSVRWWCCWLCECSGRSKIRRSPIITRHTCQRDIASARSTTSACWRSGAPS